MRDENRDENEYVTLEVVFKTKTENAVLVVYDDEETWVPRSLLSYASERMIENLERDDEVSMDIVAWKAAQMGA